MSAIETWRVLTDDGTAHKVSVKRYDADDVEAWLPDDHNRRASGSSERLAVARLAVDCEWPVVEIVVPGDLAREDEVVRLRMAVGIAEAELGRAKCMVDVLVRDATRSAASAFVNGAEAMRAAAAPAAKGANGE